MEECSKNGRKMLTVLLTLTARNTGTNLSLKPVHISIIRKRGSKKIMMKKERKAIKGLSDKKTLLLFLWSSNN